MLAGVLLLTGCSSAGQKADERVEFLKKNGASAGEVCDAARAAAKAYGDAQDAEHYERAHLTADEECLNASMFGRDMPYGANEATTPDNMDAMADDATMAAAARAQARREVDHAVNEASLGAEQATDNSEVGRANWQGE